MISRLLPVFLVLSAVLVSGCASTGEAVESPVAAEIINEAPRAPFPAEGPMGFMADNIPADAPLVEFSIESGHVMENGSLVPRFLTKELNVSVGDHVRINITNIRGRHDFKIDEFGVFSETPLNETVTVDFYADKAGTFIYYCSKPGHRAKGHWGTLNVIG